MTPKIIKQRINERYNMQNNLDKSKDTTETSTSNIKERPIIKQQQYKG